MLQLDSVSDLEPELVFGPVLDSLNQHRYSSAMMKLTLLSKNYSKDVNFLRLLAQTQKALADYTGLIKTLQCIAALTNQSVDYIEHMLALYLQGRLNEALDVGLLLQEMKLSDLSTRQAQVLSQCMIKIYLEFCDYEGVQEIIARHSDFEKDDLMLFAKGLVDLADGKKNEALSFFRRAVALNRENDQAWVSLSLLHEEMGDHELAWANLSRALDANPNNATGLKLLTKWHRRDAVQANNQAKHQTNKVISQVRHYLSRYEFDEEISLCYMQLLQDVADMNSLRFEVEKLVLQNPKNPEYISLKKKYEQGMKSL